MSKQCLKILAWTGKRGIETVINELSLELIFDRARGPSGHVILLFVGFKCMTCIFSNNGMPFDFGMDALSWKWNVKSCFKKLSVCTGLMVVQTSHVRWWIKCFYTTLHKYLNCITYLNFLAIQNTLLTVALECNKVSFQCLYSSFWCFVFVCQLLLLLA